MLANQPDWILIAHLLRPQGRKGEILAELHTDFPNTLSGRQVYLQLPQAEPRQILIESHWLPTGRNAGRVVLKLSGIDSISAAETVAKADLMVPASDRLPLESGSFYISDLIGCTVRDNGQPIGTIADVQFPASADGTARLDKAAPILVLHTPDNQEALIPFVQVYLKHLDLEGKQIEMSLPEGILDLNVPTDSSNEKTP